MVVIEYARVLRKAMRTVLDHWALSKDYQPVNVTIPTHQTIFPEQSGNVLEQRAGDSMREIKRIFVHHSASRRSKTTLEQIAQWHAERGFSEIGYHYVIQDGGIIRPARAIEKIGAHVKDHNADSIGICVCGNFMTEEPQPEQLNSLFTLITGLMNQYNIPAKSVHYHQEFGDTDCCGANLIPKVKEWRESYGKQKDTANKRNG